MEEILGNGVAMASGKIVDYQDFEASFEEVVGGDGADVAGSAGYQDFRHLRRRNRSLWSRLVSARHYFRAFSMAAVTSGESGLTGDSKRAMTLPLRSTRNFVKFHLISPPVLGLADVSVRN